MPSLSYIERNRWYITASKLKTFIKSPEAFFREYILEEIVEKEESDALVLGTAFDDALTYGSEAFNEKYWVDTGLSVEEMKKECDRLGISYTGKDKKGDFMQKLYGEEVNNKIRLTAGMGESLAGMIREANRQPLWDLGGDYERQATIEGVYRGKMKIRATLDRLSVEKGLIRDYKTTGNLKNFTFELSEEFGYDVSMAFYFALVKIMRGVECDCILDVVQSSGVYQSEVFMYQKERMNFILAETIFPALDRLFDMLEKWEETRDAAIWKNSEGVDRYKLFKLPSYPYLDTGVQRVISFI